MCRQEWESYFEAIFEVFLGVIVMKMKCAASESVLKEIDMCAVGKVGIF